MMKYSEWLAAAYGAPQGEDHSNVYGWCDVDNKIRARTGCSVNAETGRFDPEHGDKPYAISAYNIVDTTGNVWEWLSEYTNRHDAPSGQWTYYDQLGEGMGQIYGWKVDSFSSLAAGTLAQRLMLRRTCHQSGRSALEGQRPHRHKTCLRRTLSFRKRKSNHSEKRHQIRKSPD